jgi:hypothetical protein
MAAFFIASDPDRVGEVLTLSIAGTFRDRGNRNRLDWVVALHVDVHVASR